MPRRIKDIFAPSKWDWNDVETRKRLDGTWITVQLKRIRHSWYTRNIVSTPEESIATKHIKIPEEEGESMWATIISKHWRNRLWKLK